MTIKEALLTQDEEKIIEAVQNNPKEEINQLQEKRKNLLVNFPAIEDNFGEKLDEIILSGDVQRLDMRYVKLLPSLLDYIPHLVRDSHYAMLQEVVLSEDLVEQKYMVAAATLIIKTQRTDEKSVEIVTSVISSLSERQGLAYDKIVRLVVLSGHAELFSLVYSSCQNEKKEKMEKFLVGELIKNIKTSLANERAAILYIKALGDVVKSEKAFTWELLYRQNEERYSYDKREAAFDFKILKYMTSEQEIEKTKNLLGHFTEDVGMSYLTELVEFQIKPRFKELKKDVRLIALKMMAMTKEV